MLHYSLSLLGFLFFGLIHTLTATDRFKTQILTWNPNLARFYRITYSVGSILYLGVWYVFLPKSDYLFYSILGSARWIFYFIQLISIIGLIHAVLISYPAIFSGIYQLFRFHSDHFHLDEPKQAVQLRVRSVYRFVRHPMYFWSMLYLAFQPSMYDRNLFLFVLFGLYFYWGSFPEETKLIARFGEAYKSYQKQVPRLLPNGIKRFRG